MGILFKEMIENYLTYLTPNAMQKYAYNQGIILSCEEATKAVEFIKQNYKFVLCNHNNYERIVLLVKQSFGEESQPKLLKLLEITKNKYH